jgi:hypothetical protein
MADHSHNVSDRDVQDVVSKLRFISKIRKGEKINISTLTLVEDTWVNNFCRSLSSEDSRGKTLEFIKDVSSRALGYAVDFILNGDKFKRTLGLMILEDIKSMHSGIDGLVGTYGADRMFVAKIEAFQNLLNAKIVDIESRGVGEA